MVSEGNWGSRFTLGSAGKIAEVFFSEYEMAQRNFAGPNIRRWLWWRSAAHTELCLPGFLFFVVEEWIIFHIEDAPQVF